MPYLQLATHRLHYRIDGAPAAPSEKPWLLFCNSLGTDLHMWDRQVRAMAPHFRVLRYDRRGHGQSSAPTGPYALSDLGGDVIALLDFLQIEKTHFCGLSIGGLTGQWLGIHAGNRLEKIVVCATAARIGTTEAWNSRIAEVRQNGLTNLVAATAERWFTADFLVAERKTVGGVLQAFAATSIEGYAGCCAALAGADLRDGIGRIANPLLAISGDDDPVCAPSDLRHIAGRVGQGRHVCLPGRHIVNIESAPAFNAALLDFLGVEGACTSAFWRSTR